MANSTNPTWSCGKFKFDLSEPILMGICNVTPDSFSDGGEHATCDDAIAHAHKLLAYGADIIDVGGESTRPGAHDISLDDELARVLPVVSALAAEGVAVSIDTRHSLVAQACVDAGACIINDVSGFRDRKMRDVASRCSAGLVVMHMQGTPADMQDNPSYGDVVLEVQQDLVRMAKRLQTEGVMPERICIDPGIGFGKNVLHNQLLIQAAREFANLGYVLMAAVSRKSFVGAMTGIEDPALRDRASALCSAFMVGQGARIIRTHNVVQTRDALRDSRRAVIGMGSNMGNSHRHLDEALESLRHDPGIWVAAVSEYVESEPAYLQDQPPFVNAVAVLQTTYGPYELLHILQELENEHGRVRTIANGPRPLDLDIVDYESAVLDDEELVLPHPLALERDFVVTPLLDILPGYMLADGRLVTGDSIRVGHINGLA